MSLLKKGQVLTSDTSGRQYRLTTGVVAIGGFAEIYRAEQLDRSRREVCIKATTHVEAWHGEAYFGRLLTAEPAILELLDAFPSVMVRGSQRRVRYLLVFEWINQGTVHDLMDGPRIHWSEPRVIGQVMRLLKILSLLHSNGICHGDITPRNVYLRQSRLVLGDLGIASQSLRTRRVAMHGQAPPTYIPPWPEVTPARGGFTWTPSADVYQVALLALTLMSGSHMESWEMRGQLLKDAPLTDEIKIWFMIAFGLCNSRYGDASEALSYWQDYPPRPVRAPRSLAGEHVVLTGFLDTMTHPAAESRARRAGAAVQYEVTDQTTLVVKGRPNSLQVTSVAGRKLIDAQHRIRKGQKIAIISMARFEKLLLQR